MKMFLLLSVYLISISCAWGAIPGAERRTVMDITYSPGDYNGYLGASFKSDRYFTPDQYSSLYLSINCRKEKVKVFVLWGDQVKFRNNTVNQMTKLKAADYCKMGFARLPTMQEAKELARDLGYGSSGGYSQLQKDSRETVLPNFSSGTFWIDTPDLPSNNKQNSAPIPGLGALFDVTTGEINVPRDRNQLASVRCVTRKYMCEKSDSLSPADYRYDSNKSTESFSNSTEEMVVVNFL